MIIRAGNSRNLLQCCTSSRITAKLCSSAHLSCRSYATPAQADTGRRAALARRGLLYVPGSDEKKLKKSFTSEADALCFDLEDSVASDRKAGARETVFHALSAAGGSAEKLVRINSLASGLAEDDLGIVNRPSWTE